MAVLEDTSAQDHNMRPSPEEAAQKAPDIGDIALDGQQGSDVIEIPEVAQQAAQAGLAEGDAAKFLADIDRGQIKTAEEIQRRVRTRNVFVPDLGRATRVTVDEQGNALGRSGNRVEPNSAIREEREVTPEQGELLVAVSAEREETNRTAAEAEKSLKTISDTASLYKDILSSKIPTAAETGRRVRTRNVFVPDLGRATRVTVDEQGNALGRSGNRVEPNSAIREEREVTPEQGELLVAVSKERDETNGIATQAEKSLKTISDTASFCEDILSGKIPTAAETGRRVRTRNIFVSDLGRATRVTVDEQGNALGRSGNRVEPNSAIREEREVTPEQGELLVALQQEIEAARTALPQDIGVALNGLLTLDKIQRQREVMEGKKANSQVMSEIETCEKALASLESLRSAVDRCGLLIQFAGAINPTIGRAEALEKAAGVLQANENNDQQEIQLVKMLRDQLDVCRVGKMAEKVLAIGNPRVVGSRDNTPDKALEFLVLERAKLSDKTQMAVVDRLLAITGRLDLCDAYFKIFEKSSLRDLRYEERLQQLRDIPIRPSFDGIDAFAERSKLVKQGRDVLVKARTAEIRLAFGDKALGAAQIVEDIMSLPLEETEDGVLQEQLLDAFALYIAARRKDRPEDFSALFIEESLRVQRAKEPEFPESLELGRNLEAFKFLTKGFKEVILPLFQALRGENRTAFVERYLDSIRQTGSLVSRESFVIDMDRLRKQRELTPIEEDYLTSIELLTAFNPHLVAIASEAPEVARVFLQNHFSELSQRTAEGLQDGEYVPALMIGAGPAAVTALGELARIMPGLASQILLVDRGEIPGGPFAIPEGPAWDLNSANERASEEPSLPDAPADITAETGVPEEATVRAYGSPLPWYPGERGQDGAVRTGSINTTVDFLPTPDDLSKSRYPTNDDLALLLQLQAALLASRASLQTEVLQVSPSPDDGQPGDKTVRLLIDVDGLDPKEITIRTDAVITAAGLGEPTYGFPLEGSQAARILRSSRNLPADRFPLLTDTLGAFRALASRDGEIKVLGETLVVWGKGNSTDTIIEYVGQLFNGDNPSVRKVKKIIVIADGDQSTRPRYSQINDLRPRNGRENLISVVSGRVADVSLSEDGSKIRVLDSNGRPLLDADGQPIIADSGIAATGFRPTVDRVFGSYIGEGESISQGAGITPLTLPTNPDVSVADSLASDPSVLFVGTASRPDFQSPEKLAQLPPEAREALLRNGAENAVAIGFRGPDTRAAVRLFAETLRDKLPDDIRVEESPSSEKTSVPITGDIKPGSTLQLTPDRAASEVPLRRGVYTDSAILTPLLLYELGKLQIADGVAAADVKGMEFELTKGDDGDIVLTYTGAETGKDGEASTVVGASPELLARVAKAVQGSRLQAYAFRGVSTRRQDKGLKIRLGFRLGALDLRSSFMDTI